MVFPIRDRVLFKSNPLKEVICQIRFPALLRIENESPYLFQESIRTIFPIYQEQFQQGLAINAIDSGLELSQEVMDQLSKSMSQKTYLFSTEDNQWTIALTRNFLALTTKNYHRWEEFRERLFPCLNSFCEIYKPAFCTRVGLRYTNILTRSELGLSDTSWPELIQPYILGVLGADDVGNQVTDFNSQYEVKLTPNIGKVRIITRFLIKADTGEICFVFDSDFFDDVKSGPEKIADKLTLFNTQSSRAFQWAITEKLYKAMEPEIIV